MSLKNFLKSIIPPDVLEAYRARSTAHIAAQRLFKVEPEANFLTVLCDRSKISVDAGGNVGAYTWHLRNLSRRVHVFEPNPELARKLGLAFWLDRRVAVHVAGLSAHEGSAQLRIPDEANAVLHGLATIEPENALCGLSFTRQEILLQTLDTTIGDEIVGFIKIDVEGHELQVLKGATRILARDKPNLLIEAAEHHRSGAVSSLYAFLTAIGYDGVFFYDGNFHDISEFDAYVHQREDSLGRFASRLPGRQYVANFIFTARTGHVVERLKEFLDQSGNAYLCGPPGGEVHPQIKLAPTSSD